MKRYASRGVWGRAYRCIASVCRCFHTRTKGVGCPRTTSAYSRHTLPLAVHGRSVGALHLLFWLQSHRSVRARRIRHNRRARHLSDIPEPRALGRGSSRLHSCQQPTSRTVQAFYQCCLSLFVRASCSLHIHMSITVWIYWMEVFHPESRETIHPENSLSRVLYS